MDGDHRSGAAADAVVYLVRHGRTALNAGHRLRGHQNAPLDGTGREEARRLGEHFHATPLEGVVASPLQRAVATADTIAVPHRLAVERADDLLDRDYGPWTGHLEAEVHARFGDVDHAPGVEPWDRFADRVVTAFLAHAERATADLPMLIVAHDAVNRAVLWRLVPGVGATAGSIPQATGCWNRLERRGDRWTAPVVDAEP